jgi:hypothetical protein
VGAEQVLGLVGREMDGLPDEATRPIDLLRRYRMNRILMVTVAAAAALSAAGRIAVPAVAARQAGGCLTVAEQTPEQRARRSEAIGYTRSIHNAQANFTARNGRYGQMKELTGVNPLPMGATVLHAATESGYLFSVKGTAGTCAFTIYSDQNAVIYFAEPMR